MSAILTLLFLVGITSPAASDLVPEGEFQKMPKEKCNNNISRALDSSYQVNVKGKGLLTITFLDVDLKKEVKSRQAAHGHFIVGDDFKKIASANPQVHDANITGDVMNVGFPSPRSSCPKNGNCIADIPSVFLLSTSQRAASKHPVLTTGNASIRTKLVPREGDLPLTIWEFQEPLSHVQFSMHMTDIFGGSKVAIGIFQDSDATLNAKERASALLVFKAAISHILKG